MVRHLPLLVLLALVPSGCVNYVGRRATVEQAVATMPGTSRGALTFEQAVARLVRDHPELHVLRAEAAAIHRTPGPGSLETQAMVADGNLTETLVRTDILALLGLGPIRGKRALARALVHERVMKHHERARALVGDLATAYLTHQLLRTLPTLSIDSDVSAYKEAGLLPEATAKAARAIAEEAAAESTVLESELRELRRQIAELVGATPDSEITPSLAEGTSGGAWPPLPQPSEERLVYGRGDLQRLVAAYRVADRRFRLAVQEQTPTVRLGAGANVDLSFPMQMLSASVPLDGAEKACAMGRARFAAWRKLQAGVHAARHDVKQARIALDAARARVTAARKRMDAAKALAEAEAGRLETDPAALTPLVLVWGREIAAWRALRQATKEWAMARARAAVASGWPSAVGGTE